MIEYSVLFTNTEGKYVHLFTPDDDLFVTTDPEEANLRSMMLRPAQEDRHITPDAVVVYRTRPNEWWQPVRRFGDCGGCGERFELVSPKFLVPGHTVKQKQCRGGLRYPHTFLPIDPAELETSAAGEGCTCGAEDPETGMSVDGMRHIEPCPFAKYEPEVVQ